MQSAENIKKSSTPFVSVIIVNYNNKNYLINCLKSVFESNYPHFEVVLVDNASFDGSIKDVEKNFAYQASLKIIRNSQNVGFASGNNIGILYSKGEYLVFLNNDTEVDKNWLSELVRAFESDDVGAVQCKLLYLHDKEHFDSAGCFIDFLGFPLIRGLNEKDNGQYDLIDEIFYGKGAALAARRSLLDEIGCFDDDYFLYFEETDLCWRMHLKNLKVVYAPESIVFHAGEASISKKSVQKSLLPNYHKHKNHITTLIKNYELQNLVKYLPVMLFVKTLTDFLYFRSDNFVRIRAILYNLKNVKKIYKKRLEVQKFRRTNDASIFKQKIIKPFDLKNINQQNQLLIPHSSHKTEI